MYSVLVLDYTLNDDRLRLQNVKESAYPVIGLDELRLST